MNNTDKLLRAFIEVSGFDIEKIVDTKETPISKQSGMNRATASAMTMTDNNLSVTNDGEYKRGDDGCYYLKASMDVDYKITKRDCIHFECEGIKHDGDYFNSRLRSSLRTPCRDLRRRPRFPHGARWHLER